MPASLSALQAPRRSPGSHESRHGLAMDVVHKFQTRPKKGGPRAGAHPAIHTAAPRSPRPSETTSDDPLFICCRSQRPQVATQASPTASKNRPKRRPVSCCFRPPPRPPEKATSQQQPPPRHCSPLNGELPNRTDRTRSDLHTRQPWPSTSSSP
ncbi:hypothetical protein B0T11DRAFT_47083 [Plectosphaerella cucumerina]|uniref:Uncharacterized protein n=1 Tax=Plectosphaerella cucumerina TaxID=40658 RepID=A0A8K0TFU1_9PEZI|nr:hypothetical protein B0T11DRAFT_47083 [Plectosphaerella cucumerina]